MGYFIVVTHPEHGIIAESKIYGGLDAGAEFGMAVVAEGFRKSHHLQLEDSNGNSVFVPYNLLGQCVIRVIGA